LEFGGTKANSRRTRLEKFNRRLDAGRRPQETRFSREREERQLAAQLRDVDYFAKRVIFEDNRLLVVDKPVGIATMGAEKDEESLFTLAQRYVKAKYDKPGAVYLGVVSRLDLTTSGVVVFARNSKAAERLNAQFRERKTQKTYRALVEGVLRDDERELVDVVCEDKANRRLWIPNARDDVFERFKKFDPKEARLTYRVVERFKNATLLDVDLATGRKHQIRLQLSKIGAPIVGDGKYGARPIPQLGICLHASSLTLTHPTTLESMTFNAACPDWSVWERV